MRAPRLLETGWTDGETATRNSEDPRRSGPDTSGATLLKLGLYGIADFSASPFVIPPALASPTRVAEVRIAKRLGDLNGLGFHVESVAGGMSRLL